METPQERKDSGEGPPSFESRCQDHEADVQLSEETRGRTGFKLSFSKGGIRCRRRIKAA